MGGTLSGDLIGKHSERSPNDGGLGEPGGVGELLEDAQIVGLQSKSLQLARELVLVSNTRNPALNRCPINALIVGWHHAFAQRQPRR